MTGIDVNIGLRTPGIPGCDKKSCHGAKHVSYCGFVVDSIIEEQGGKGCFGLERI